MNKKTGKHMVKPKQILTTITIITMTTKLSFWIHKQDECKIRRKENMKREAYKEVYSNECIY